MSDRSNRADALWLCFTCLPSLVWISFACVVTASALAGCPISEVGHPDNDDTSKPADGGTDGGKATEGNSPAPGTPAAAAGDGDGDQTCEAELERVTAELAECKGAK